MTSLEERYTDVPRFDTVGDLVARGRFDGAIVCLPNRETSSVLNRLAAAGKHLLSEKPCGSTAADFEPAAAAIRAAGVAFQTGYLWRYDSVADRVRAMIADGRFGRLISVEIDQFTSDVAHRGASHFLFDRDQSGRGFFNWL